RSAGVLVGALVLGVVGGIGGAAGYSALVDDGIFSTSDDEGGSDGDTRITAGDVDAGGIDPLDLVSVNDISNAVLPAVVQINTPAPGGYAQGSGFVVSDDGEILTNHHVIEDASPGEAIVITFDDGTFAEAEIVGSDPLLDVALLELVDPPDDLTVASLGSSDDTEVGQAVVAIGAPYGLQSTVTAGIVSALNRPFVLELPSGLVAYPAIQTDAAVNSGNSGGPLVNLRGEVIGINGAIELAQSESGYDAGFIGISYAIPIDDVRHVVDQLREGDEPEHASLGAIAETAVVENIVDGAAVLVELAPDGAAAEAGLAEGDMITQIGELHVNSSRALVTSVLTFEPGEEVEVTYLDARGNEETTTVTLGSDLDD
ncbi:MAG TPA: trypsin-like peptidase domain-containing protein, partial [Nocardioides sp.]